MLELVAKVRNTDMLTTLRWLTEQGVTFPPGAVTQEGADEYLKAYPRTKARFIEYARTAGHNFAEDETLARDIASRMHIYRDLHPALWHERLGNFIGCSTRIDAQKAFWPHIKDAVNLHEVTHGDLAIFKGRGWADVLVIPFHDLPKRPSGFLFVGREGKPSDMIFASLFGGLSPRTMTESGLCMYDTMLVPTDSPQLFGNATFVMDDPLEAIRMQIRHMRDHTLPLPIVSAYNRPLPSRSGAGMRKLTARHVWKHQPFRKLFFWGPTYSANLVNMAVLAGGKLCMRMPRDATLNTITSRNWLLYVQEHAIPWQVELERIFTPLDKEELAQRLEGLDIPYQLFDDFINNCPPKLQDAIYAASKREKNIRYGYIGHSEVQDTASGWRFVLKNQPITDARLRIDRIVSHKLSHEAFYHGRILYKEHEIPFTVPGRQIKTKTMDWMETIVREACGGVPICNRAWQGNIVDLAQQFQPPETSLVTGRAGWDPQSGSFVLPRFIVQPGGRVIPAPPPVVDNLTPAAHLKAPDGLPAWLAELTTDTEAHKVFWATAAAIAANIIAPALNQQTTAIGLVGDGAKHVGLATAKELGCAEYTLGRVNSSTIAKLDEIQSATLRHGWPSIMMTSLYTTRIVKSDWYGLIAEKNAIVELKPHEADAVAVVGPWTFVNCEQTLKPSATIAQYGAQLLPHWLVNLSSRRLELRSTAQELPLRVLDDMAAWVAEYGDGDLVRSCGGMLEAIHADPAAQALRLMRAMFYFISSGILLFQQAANSHKFSRKASILRVVSHDPAAGPSGIFIAQTAINQLLASKGLPVLERQHGTDIFASAGALMGEFDYNDELGWLLKESWWNRHFELCRARHRHHLRVVG